MKKALFLIVILMLIGGFFTYKSNEKKLASIQKEKKEYQNILKKKERELKEVNNVLKNLDTPESKEKLAREQLGYVKKDEIEYIIKKNE